jgi:hypothetical protein
LDRRDFSSARNWGVEMQRPKVTKVLRTSYFWEGCWWELALRYISISVGLIYVNMVGKGTIKKSRNKDIQKGK